jgi:hypothetical protein
VCGQTRRAVLLGIAALCLAATSFIILDSPGPAFYCWTGSMLAVLVAGWLADDPPRA